MDFKIFLTTFAAILVAELADKTQLVGITMSSKSARPLSVWLGSVSAYMIITAISVAAGAFLGQYLPDAVLRYGGGSIFLIIGVLIITGRLG